MKSFDVEYVYESHVVYVLK